MLPGPHWLVWLHVLASLATFGLAAYVWRLPDRPSRIQWVTTLTAMAGSVGSYGLALLVFDPALRAALELVTLAGILWAGISFLGFALVYTGREHFVASWRYRLVVAAGLVMSVVGVTNPVHSLLWTDFRVTPLAGMAAAGYEIQPLLFVVAGGVYMIVGVGSALLVELAANYTSTTVRRVLIFGLVPFFPLLAGLAWLFALGPYPQLNLVALAFFPHTVVDVYALYYRDLLQLPAGLQRTGRQAAIEDLATPVLMVSTDDRLVDLNAAAEDLFETDTQAVRGESVETLLGTDVDPTAGEQQVELTVDGQRCIYNLSASRFESEGGSHRGYTVSIQDVTDEIQTKQRLNVLNRILRHNLRNDLNVVRLRAEHLAEDGLTDAQRDDVAEIRTTAKSLSELGTKARRATHAMENVATDTVSLRAAIDAAVENATADAQDTTVTVDVPPDLTLSSDRDLLGLVFTSVVENAVEHGSTGSRSAADDAVEQRSTGNQHANRSGDTVGYGPTSSRPDARVETDEPGDAPEHGDGDPSAVISVTEMDEWIRVDVTDDGPGIPEYERVVIEDGDESPLEHGSGLGLWLVEWGVTVLGGDVSFDVDDGTTVSIRLPTTGGSGSVGSNR